MYKVSYSTDIPPDGTGYNDPPALIKEISQKEFVDKKLYDSTIVNIESRIMRVDKNFNKVEAPKFGRFVMPADCSIIHAKLFWCQDDTGYAISYGDSIRYFVFGCDHSFNEKSIIKDKHTYQCSKCSTEIPQPWSYLLKEDSDWLVSDTSIRNRGLMDYYRIMRFSKNLTDGEIKSLTKFLTKVGHPGYGGVGCGIVGTYEYKLTAHCDSSD
jgi:hypothetical protein